MSTKLFIFTSLLALTSALRSTLTERRQVNTECPQTNPGTQFYHCSNGYVGCFAEDPCAFPPFSTTTPSIPSATPIPTRHEITEPRSYNIYPQNGNGIEDPVPHVDLQKVVKEGIVTTNALVFDNVPENAKNCRLDWRSDKANDRSNFFVEGAGQAYFRQLLGFPSRPVSVIFETLKRFQDTEKEFSQGLDFTGWENSPAQHIGPSLKCARQVAVELKGEEGGEDANRVFIANTATNGLYLTYELS